MRIVGPIRTVMLALVLFAGGHALAQSPYDVEPPRWHVTGSAGIDLNGSSQSTLPMDTSSSQLFPLGDLRLNTDGYLLDPKFLHINGGFNFQRGVNESDRGSIDSNGLGLAISTSFLPRSHVPLRVNYTKNTYGLNGLGVNQDNDDSRLTVDWTAMFPNLPRFTLGLQQFSNVVRVPHSFNDRSFSDRAINVGASDIWKGWQWAANAAMEGGSTSGVIGLDPGTNLDNSSRSGSFNLNRGFWENKARIWIENRIISLQNMLGAGNNTDSQEMTNSVNFDAQLTSKWSAQAGYAHSSIDFNNTGLVSNLANAGTTRIIALSSSEAHSITGRANYQVLPWLRLTEELRETRLTPAETVVESRVGLTESVSTVAFERRLRSFDVNASYSGTYQLTGTTLDQSPSSWSNGVNARIGWGSTQRVRITGVYANSRLNLVEQIGGYADQQRARLEAETHRLKLFRLRASVEEFNIAILNISGKTESKGTNLSVTAEHRLVSASYSQSFGSGAGELFPDNAINRQFLVIPLPVNQLLGTPLLDRTVNARSLAVVARPRRRLDAIFTWRKERNLLATSDQFYDTLQFDARYHMGKVTLEGGYTRNLTNVTSSSMVSGDRVTRWYVRVARDFTIF